MHYFLLLLFIVNFLEGVSISSLDQRTLSNSNEVRKLKWTSKIEGKPIIYFMVLCDPTTSFVVVENIIHKDWDLKIYFYTEHRANKPHLAFLITIS